MLVLIKNGCILMPPHDVKSNRSNSPPYKEDFHKISIGIQDAFNLILAGGSSGLDKFNGKRSLVLGSFRSFSFP